jgi:hypothetical protein
LLRGTIIISDDIKNFSKNKGGTKYHIISLILQPIGSQIQINILEKYMYYQKIGELLSANSVFGLSPLPQ